MTKPSGVEHPPARLIIQNGDQERCSLPFARLKLKPVQRMSCLLDYEGLGGLPGLEGEKINKRQSRAGLAVGGKCQAPGTGGTGGTRHSNNLGQCFLCLEQATTQCTWCGTAHLCSEEHLKLHRPNTKCLPFRVAKIEGKGRGLVATRAIRARETILTESPGVRGPGLVSSPVCPGCLAPVRAPLLPCSRCSLPVCSPACEQSPAHKPECDLLAENRVKVNIQDCDSPATIYSFITPYRLLMMRRTDPETFSRVASLPDHIVQRAGLGEWDVHQRDIVNFLRRRCFLSKTFSDEDIHRAIGIISINSVSLEPRRLFSGPPKGRTGLNGRAIFPTFSLLNHSCVGNAKFSLDSSTGQIRVEARRSIKEGEELTVQYYSSYLGTHKRRRKLRSEWYFDCSCERCRDPSELGTNVSSVLCEACEEGYLLPRDPLDTYSDWPCTKCDFYLEVEQEQFDIPTIYTLCFQVPDLERKIDQLEEELNFLSSKKDLRRLESFISELSSKVLHPQHYLLLIARRNYKYISQKQLIAELARCDALQQESLKEGSVN